ncbi:PKD domain-containing protein [Pontibacter diazotrophicus]|uniref:PKD domain-containing protein n=1 Tax=Pontibacter diazotrophicus TaxID=1400979 RepID=A0A3D8LJ30_9BACT|nr:ThuA domain-containing protein [Pontibacter diazotrophicus]RDV16972.1 PKD domain-containing protein [Pontibacter diazotrophicus]
MIQLPQVSKHLLRLLCFSGITLGAYACLSPKQQASQEAATPRVLVFSKTKGWKHTSIPHGIAAFQKMAQENGFRVDTTINASYFVDDSLRNYQAVVFLSTTGNVLNPEQEAAFERYIQAGGGYMGIHAAADTEYDWPWYDKLMGAHFSSHPLNPGERKATVEILDKNHPATAGLPDRWERTDEWYSYKSFYPGLKVLANLDENTYEGGTNGANHPIAWYHEFDGGRAFYTGGGHMDESYSDSLFVNHLLGGLQYAIGDGKLLDYSKSYAKVVPEQNRFMKTVLVNDLNVPMELAVSDDGRIFYSELSGSLFMYNTKTGQNKLLHQFPVVRKGGTGLIGVTLDPNFAENNFIYLYYSPPKAEEPYLFNLSRFKVSADNTLDLASEKVLLQVPVQENSGSHHGGSLAWDKDGNLYLSTGDSTTPFPSEGYAPIDERPGKEYYSMDAQRAAANTNDLKGKILRIHPEPDGTYTIPEGNLFPKGTEKTLPEIYVMGTRNPYRIAVNPKTSVLYWGEIGPDAGKDSIQGPRGYDEFNQAKQPGNYGWPYFVGNNYAYAEWDFATKTAGPLYDPEAPVNNSPNNTGLTNLPPATPAMIWYPYAASKEFPELGVGGRSAMAGAFYTFDPNSTSPSKFPEYYDGSLFLMEWMRNWVMAARFDENENYLRSEPFMTANGDFRRPIDMAFGKDGVMYMLEYGSVYGADNDDARLVKIEYNRGNRAPIAKATLTDSAAVADVNKRVFLTSERDLPEIREAIGQAPLRVLFSSRGTRDLDEDDKLTYEWLFDGKTVGSTKPNPVHTYTQNGIYNAILRVTDTKGLVNTDTIRVSVGNAMPVVNISTPGNKSFFWENKPLPYTVAVSDKEDTKIDPKQLKVYFNYNPQQGNKSAAPVMGHQDVATVESLSLGESLIASSDCKACHTIDKVSVGPSYTAVAQRYKGQEDAVATLAKKVIDGGGGNWGKTYVMSAHPQLAQQDAQEMVKYILSLSDKKKEQTILPAQGTLTLKDHKADEPAGRYTLMAVYTDKGGKEVGPLTNSDVITLRNAKVKTAFADAHVGFPRWGNSLSQGDHKSYILLRNVDLTGIQQFTYEYASQDKDGEIEVRIDSQGGPVISRTPYKATGSWDEAQKVTGDVTTPTTGKHDVYFIVVKPDKPNNDIISLSTIEFKEGTSAVQNP